MKLMRMTDAFESSEFFADDDGQLFILYDDAGVTEWGEISKCTDSMSSILQRLYHECVNEEHAKPIRRKIRKHLMAMEEK